jgi:hypothetical protein
MSFVLLVVEEPEARSGGAAQRRDRFDRMMRFTADLERRGLHLASESLRSLKDRVRVQSRGGKRILLDGPFAETKEVVGGFFLVDCATKAEALAIAAECPAAEWAAIEVREVGPCNSGE